MIKRILLNGRGTSCRIKKAGTAYLKNAAQLYLCLIDRKVLQPAAAHSEALLFCFPAGLDFRLLLPDVLLHAKEQQQDCHHYSGDGLKPHKAKDRGIFLRPVSALRQP